MKEYCFKSCFCAKEGLEFRQIFTSPLEGEDARRAGEGVSKKEDSFIKPPSFVLRTFSPSRGEIARAFTLIELLVVVLIIGILAAVAVPQYQKAVKKARLAEVFSVFSSTQQAVNAYLLEKGFPAQGTVHFTGTENLEELAIDLPGEKCSENYNCINSGAYDVGCASTHCGISLRTSYFKDGSTGNTWLAGEPFGLVLVPGSSQWVLAYVPKDDLAARKLICQWWKGPIEDYTDITSSFAGKTRCAEVGVE